MAEEYIIGSNAQFNDSVEILKDLTLYGVVENTTDFAVKIQGDEKLRITSDSITFTDTLTALSVTAPSGIFSGIITATNVSVAQSVTANEYYGTFKGSIDPSVANDKISEGNSSAEVVDTGSDGHFKVITEGDEILRITSTGLEVQKNGVPAIISNYNNSKHIQMDAGNDGAGFQLTTGNYFAINHQPYADRGTNNNLTERLRILSGGMLVRGHTESAGQIDTQLNSQNQFHGNDRKGGIRIADFSDSPFPASLQFVKSRAGTVGVNTTLQDGDRMGSIYWGGANGTNYQPVAYITGKTDGTVSSTSIPGAITFGTNAGDDLRDRIKIDPNGNFNIGVHDSTNPFTYLRFGASLHGAADIRPTNELNHKVGLAFYVDGTQDTTINPTEQLRITSSGNLQFNSGFGSVQTAYGVRAWALWNGETNTLLDDGNIAGFTDEGTGTYTFTFDNNMPDSNYVVTGSTGRNAKPHFSLNSNIRNAGNFRISTGTWGSSYTAVDVDSAMFCVIC